MARPYRDGSARRRAGGADPFVEGGEQLRHHRLRGLAEPSLAARPAEGQLLLAAVDDLEAGVVDRLGVPRTTARARGDDDQPLRGGGEHDVRALRQLVETAD